MAYENRVQLHGRISKIESVCNLNRELLYKDLYLDVVRRFGSLPGSKRWEFKYDSIKVRVRDEKWLDFLKTKRLREGDWLEVHGVACLIDKLYSFTCSECGQLNTVQVTDSYVHPLQMLQLKGTAKIVQEYMDIDPDILELPVKEIKAELERWKTTPGWVTSMSKPLEKNSNGTVRVQITVRQESSGDENNSYMTELNKSGNVAYVMGNLCKDPIFNNNDTGGRVCTYPVAINRKVYIRFDSPFDRTDYIYIKSLGKQAELDYKCLKTSSLLFIDGSLQSRSGYQVPHPCMKCGAVHRRKGYALEVVPYHVTYLEDYDEPEDDPEESALDLDEDDGDTETREFENRMILHGYVSKIRERRNPDGSLRFALVDLMTAKRPRDIPGIKSSASELTVLTVFISIEKWLKWYEESRISEGDWLEVLGVLCSVHRQKEYQCTECKGSNSYDEDISYVHPLQIIQLEDTDVFEDEIIELDVSDVEYMSTEEIEEVLDHEKKSVGKLVRFDEPEYTDYETVRYRIRSRIPTPENEIRNHLFEIGETSNLTHVMGVLEDDPVYTNGRCEYTLTVTRRGYIERRPTVIISDIIRVKTFGEQARKDSEALKKGSSVFIDGFAYSDTHAKECECLGCQTLNKVKNHEIIVIPYSVEYLKDYTRLDPIRDHSKDNEVVTQNGYVFTKGENGVVRKERIEDMEDSGYDEERSYDDYSEGEE